MCVPLFRTQVSRITSIVHQIRANIGKANQDATFCFDKSHICAVRMASSNCQFHYISYDRFGIFGNWITTTYVVTHVAINLIERTEIPSTIYVSVPFFLSIGYHSRRELHSDTWLLFLSNTYLWWMWPLFSNVWLPLDLGHVRCCSHCPMIWKTIWKPSMTMRNLKGIDRKLQINCHSSFNFTRN